jgi:hypothetical protein
VCVSTRRVFAELHRAQSLARLVTDHPTTLQASDNSHTEVVRRGRVVGVLHDPDLAEFLGCAPVLLRCFAEALATVHADHRPRHGHCTNCGQLAPCSTRRLLEHHLIRPSRGTAKCSPRVLSPPRR